MMISHRLLIALSLIFSLTLLSASAWAQTSMQRRAQQEDGSSQQDSPEVRTTQEQQSNSTQESNQRVETIREVRPTDGIMQPFRVHLPGVRLDFGTPWGSSQGGVLYGVGVGYMFAMGWDVVPIEETQAVIRFGAGPDLTLIVSGEGVHGVGAFMAGRAGVVGTAAGGIDLEGALGAGIGPAGFAPALRAGIYWGGEVFEIGYFYQHTFFGRPGYMRPHQIAIRLHIPVLRH